MSEFVFRPLSGDIKDTDWIQQAMFVPDYRNNATIAHKRSRIRTGASGKFYDTTPGGNRVMNPLPQFTRTADIKNYGIGGISHGMGRYYSEAIDDNVTQLTMSFGTPEFNSLASFLGTFHNPYMATLVNRGESAGFSYRAGQAIGFITTLPLQAFYGIVSLVNRTTAMLTGNPYSKFYYMKTTMSLYWNAVTTIYNEITTVLGVTPGASKDANGNVIPASQAEIDLAKQYLPDIIRTNSDPNVAGINIFALSTRSQRLANAQREAIARIGEDKSGDAYVKALADEMSRVNTTPSKVGSSYGKFIESLVDSPSYKKKEPKQVVVIDTNGEEITLDQTPLSLADPSHWDYLMAELAEGSTFVSFAVEPTGYTESFSNSTKTSVIAEKLRGANNAARDMNFAMAEGNVVGDTVKSVTNMLKDAATGALDVIGLGGVGAVLGDAYVEIPKVYDSSSAELGNPSYKIRLQPPYSNALSMAYHVYPTVAMLLAAALPRSTGKHAYTSPFNCSAFSQGRTNISLGMISSLKISRGVSNIGWNGDNLPGAIELDFTIDNLDEIAHIPIAESLGITNAFNAFDESSTFSDYLSTLGSMDLYSSFYANARFDVAWRRTKMKFDTFTSAASVAQAVSSTSIGGMAKIFAAAGALD